VKCHELREQDRRRDLGCLSKMTCTNVWFRKKRWPNRQRNHRTLVALRHLPKGDTHQKPNVFDRSCRKRQLRTPPPMKPVLAAALLVVLLVLILRLCGFAPSETNSVVVRVAAAQPTPTRVLPLRRPDESLAARDEVNAVLARLAPREQRRLLKHLACVSALDRPAVLVAAQKI
jgi:hypothetical protein